MNFDLFQYLSALAFIYIYGRLAIHIIPGVWNYFINEPFNYQKKLEKIRIFFNLIGLGFMHFMSYSHSSIDNKGVFFQLIITFTFFLGFFFCHLTWTEKFRHSFLAQKRNSFNKSSENFSLSISENQITDLYNEMARYELLNQDKTSIEDFKKVLLEDWTGHNSKIYLKMDGPSCREFYDYFVKAFPSNNLTLKSFFTNSKLVLRPDGKTYEYNTIKNAPTRNTYSKRHAD